MTDQQMHDRLQAAGARFREQSATTSPVDELLPAGGRRRARTALAVAAAAVVLLVVGLAVGLRGSPHPAGPSGDTAGLLGNVWLVSPDGKPSTASLYISRSGALVADDECRLIGAKAAVSGNRLTITDAAVRLKPCTDQYGPGFYGKGARVLSGSVRFRIDAQAMTITRAGVGSLRFVLAQTPIPPPSLDVPTLTGTDWVAPSGSVLHIDPRTGQLSGGLCAGRADVSGPAIRFSGCPLLGRVDRAVLAGTTLTLKTSPGPRWQPGPSSFRFHWRPTGASSIDPGALAGRTWHLESVAGSPASSGSLRIAHGIATVDNGCTTSRHPARVGRGTFVFITGEPTRACSDPAATADSFLFADPATWVVRAGELIVYGGGSQAFSAVYGTSAPSRPHQNPAALLGHRWQLPPVHLNDKSSDAGMVTFTRAGYTIAHACYYRTGAAQLGSDTIVFGKGRTIQHSCPLNANTLEQGTRSIDAVFAGELHWSIVDDVLTLSGRAGTLLLRPAGAHQSRLTDNAWRLTGTAHGGQKHPAVGVVVLNFPTERSLLVKRCYQSSAAVMVLKRALTVGVLRTTLARPCPSGPPGTQEQNSVIDSVLKGTASWAIDGDRLTLSRGTDALVFSRRP